MSTDLMLNFNASIAFPDRALCFTLDLSSFSEDLGQNK